MTLLNSTSILNEKVTYTLTKTQNEFGLVYGVKITSTLFDLTETCEVKDVSSDYETVRHFLNLLIDCCVLPSALKEVTYDYISAIFSV